jgi:xanthine dehydrogenase accessory factor
MIADKLAPFQSVLDADWPAFGWAEDIRPALKTTRDEGRASALATLFRVEGSAPRGPGAQMLFDGKNAAGFFSGGCVEADVEQHASNTIADGEARSLHYGTGSPWVDIRLRCGGAIYIFVERIAADSAAAADLLAFAERREPALWISDGKIQRVAPAGDAPLLQDTAQPLSIVRRFDPPRRIIVSGWDPTALAIAKLGADAQFEIILTRPDGPETPPPIGEARYLRMSPSEAIEAFGVDPWTAFIGASHDSELDLPACAAALSRGAGYVGLLGAASRLPERTETIRDLGAPPESLAHLRAPAGVPNLGKAPWRIAVGVITEIMQTMNSANERA